MKCAADFRRIARESLRGKWLIAVLTGLVAAILGGAAAQWPEINFYYGGGTAQVNLEVLGQDVPLLRLTDGQFSGIVLAELLRYVAVAALVIAIAQFILGCIVTVGYACFNLRLVDGEEVSLDTLFKYFPQWKTMVIAGLLQTLYVVLWSLLFVIPGIIASYRYAMTSFILAENPELTASEAIDRSKELMSGNKWRLFCLSFSFIGWGILCVFTLGIGNLWLTPYIQAAFAAFYRDITLPKREESIPLMAPTDM